MPNAVHLSTAHSATDTRIFHKELRTLVEAGYDVQYYVHHDRDETRNGVRIKSLGNASSRVERWKHLYKIYDRAYACNADIYHLHDPELLPIGVALSKKTNGRVIYDAHEDYERVAQTRAWIPDVLKPLLAHIVPQIEANIALQLDATIAATKWVADSFREQGASSVTVLNNFPIIRDINVPKRTQADSTECSLVYVGSVTRVRGADSMIKLVSTLRDMGRRVTLKIIGPFGDSQVEREIRSLVKRKGLTDCIKFIGPVSYEDVFDHLFSADIGLALLKKEPHKGSIPTKIFEYMYCSLPFLMTEIKPLVDSTYFSSDWGKVVPEGDVGAQSEAVCQLMDDSEQRVAMGAAGRKAVEESFNWQQESKKLLHLYDDLL